MNFMLLRNRDTRKPVSYSTIPVGDDFALLIRTFACAQPLEVRRWECDGSREALHEGFKTTEGWRDAKV